MEKARNLVKMSQAELDELFTRGSVGEIPKGDSKGVAIIAAGTLLARVIAPITTLLFWQGKVFYPDQSFYMNRATPFRVEIFKGEIYKGESRFDGKECIILDYSNTSFLLKKVKEEMRQISPGFYLAFVYWSGRRLSNFTLEF